jgi:hypothetical protein
MAAPTETNQTGISEPLKIWIDIGGHDHWHRTEFENLLKSIATGRKIDAVMVDSRDRADCVLRIGNSVQLSQSSILECLKWNKPTSPREFVWDYGDLPSGSLPGFYASLPSYMFDRRRHRAFGLPIECNELVRPYDLKDAKYLYGFFGAATSAVRGRMRTDLQAHPRRQEGLIEFRDSIWLQMFDRSGVQAKIDYTENLRQCRFILCPRGNVLAGAGSRLYETMQAARVPVLISDWITLPEGVDWDECSVRIKERHISRIPEILDSYSGRWEQMAANARRSWEAHFSSEATLDELGRQLKSLLKTYSEENALVRLAGRGRMALGYAAYTPRLYYRHLQNLMARGRAAFRRGPGS